MHSTGSHCFRRRHLPFALAGLLASAASVQAIPETPTWYPAPFLQSRTLPHAGHDDIPGYPMAVDFKPWEAVWGSDGDYYGFVNDGAVPGGLIFALDHEIHPIRFNYWIAPGQPRRIYSFGPAVGPSHRISASHPAGSLAVGQDGSIYGRATDGGAFAAGVLFKVDRSGRYQALHHFEKHGVPGQLLAAQNGDVFAATTADDSANVGWVFRLSKDGSYENIPVASGEMKCLVETESHAIILGTVPAGDLPDSQKGVLWKLNASGEFEHFADVGNFPSKLLALPGGDLACLTKQSLLRVSAAGAVTVVHDFTVPAQGLIPEFIAHYVAGYFLGSTSAGGLSSGGGTSFTVADDGTNYRFRTLGSPGDNRTLNWMDDIFPSRFVADSKQSDPIDPKTANIPPAARDDVLSATLLKRKGTGPLQAVIRVLDNDNDADKNALTIVSVTPPANGVVAVDPTSRVITYTANGAPALNDTFSYTISDGHGGTATAQVFVRTSPAGRYAGQVLTVPGDGSAGTTAGTLALSVNGDRSLSGRLVLDGRTYAFAGRANDVGQLAAVFANNISPNSLALQLTLRPNGAGWTVAAALQKNGAPLAAVCTK